VNKFLHYLSYTHMYMNTDYNTRYTKAISQRKSHVTSQQPCGIVCWSPIFHGKNDMNHITICIVQHSFKNYVTYSS